MAVEYAIISVIRFHSNSQIHGSSFKGSLSIDSVRGVKGNLMLNMDISRGTITEHSSSTEFITVWFSTCSMEETASYSGLKLVHIDGLAWIEFALLERADIFFFL